MLSYERSFSPLGAIHLNPHYLNNTLRTTRYTWLSFVPLAILNQLRQIYNIYFLIQMVISLFPQISPFAPFSVIFPVVFVFSVSLIRELIQNCKRGISDYKTNRLPVLWIGERRRVRKLCCIRKITGKSALMTLQRQKWANIAVGDIILLQEDARIPADLLLLKVSQKNGDSYVQTANLDGERNLKRKSATLQGMLEFDPKTQNYLSNKDYNLIRSAVLEYGRPEKQLDKFGGNLRLEDEQNGTQDFIPLSHHNLILRGSNIANTKWALGMVMYTGRETKLMLNQDKARYKISRLGRMVNRTMIVIVIVQMLFCLIGAIGSVIENPSEDIVFAERSDNEGLLFLVSFLTFYVLFGTFVPISLLVTLEIIRVLQMVLLQADKEMKDPVTGQSFKAYNGIIPQDLGNITHLFTDKTGTLTANIMQFKGFSFGHRNQEIQERETSMIKN